MSANKRTERTPPREIRNPELVKTALDMSTDWVRSQPDPESVAIAAGWLMNELGQLVDALSVERVAAVRQLRTDGWSLAEIGFSLGLSRARIDQIAKQ